MLICSTTSNLNNFKPQQLQPQKRVQNEKKKQNRRPQPRENTLKIPPWPHFFSELCDFFLKFFGLHQRVPLHLFRYFATQWMSKNYKGSPLLHFFGTVTLFKNLIKIFFGQFFHVSKGSPLQFLKFFATSWSFTKPEGSPFKF